MTDGQRKGENSVFVQQRINYWSKYCLKEYISCFEGREERAVTESEKKRIPDLGSESITGQNAV